MRCRIPRAPILAALALAFAVAPAAAVVPAGLHGSPLALPLVTGHEKPGLVLAQRAIERSWGPSEDTTYVEVNVPEWRSEGLAAGLSAVLPGAGQAYVGERSSLLFGLLEVVGWWANRYYVHKAQVARDQAARFAGNPADSASAWSFARWSQATGGDPSALQAMWANDPEAFYETIGRNSSYLSGWGGSPIGSRDAFLDMRGQMRGKYLRATEVAYGLWANHLLAALDALRAARLHNVPLQENLQLKLRTSWHRGSPELQAALERRF